MITKVYTGRISRYYPETRFYEPVTGVRAAVAVPFEQYDFDGVDDVPADGDWGDPDTAYIPERGPDPDPGPTPMEERQAWHEALANEAAEAADEQQQMEAAERAASAAPPPAPARTAAAAVSSAPAGAAEVASTPPAPGQEG